MALIPPTMHDILPRQSTTLTCTLQTCPLSTSYYFYRVSLAANVVFLILFGISFLAYILTYLLTRRATAFTVAMVPGVVLECIGYGGRIASWQNQWKDTGFLMQIVCLSIAPAFIAAAIYFCLRRVVCAFGEEGSRIRPVWYTRIFIPCDILSIILQGAGGGLASASSRARRDPKAGNSILIAGLAFQVFTLFIFILLCLDFTLRTYRRYASLGVSAFEQSPVRQSKRFKGFIAALVVATICIFWRSVYRVAELADGWEGSLIKRQWLFVGFEGVMVVVAVGVLNVFHPAWAFEGGVVEGGIGRKDGKEVGRGERSGSGATSDGEKTVGVNLA
ncbi:hypothetical protein HYFRA_00001886 [Hymenoscyphus fraxineus]|uniref:RTA1-domain-containing protein n=1 Tax=Hymenoscyphus fraxineus TaxID=746836 RepID=A0A9N9KJK9_9HELO|nr:hypothetical protein HYFRA_00001886 [Hymenoscyphus fraxineus]